MLLGKLLFSEENQRRSGQRRGKVVVGDWDECREEKLQLQQQQHILRALWWPLSINENILWTPKQKVSPLKYGL